MPRFVWTNELIWTDARQYGCTAAYRNTKGSSWQAAYKRGMLTDVTAHMARSKRPDYTTEELEAEALLYSQRRQFELGSPNHYEAARRRKMLDQVCGHMSAAYADWDLQTVTNIALDYVKKVDFWKNDRKAYLWAERHGHLAQVCVHMKRRQRFTDDELAAAAKLYTTDREFRTGHPRHWSQARKREVFDDITTHFKLPNGGKSKAEVAYSASFYDTRGEFLDQKPTDYKYAHSKGWLDDVCDHMHEASRKVPLHRVRAAANLCIQRREFETRFPAEYQASCRHYDHDEVCSHMVHGGGTTNDAIYLWGCELQGIYKVGVTSAHIGNHRIDRVAGLFGVKPKVIRIAPTIGKATNLETKLLRIGKSAGLSGFDGATEFRILTAQQLAEAVELIDANTVQHNIDP